MPEQIGKIIRIKNRFPGPRTVAVNTVGEGLRRHINLCFACARFAPTEPARHCPIAKGMFGYCKQNGVATALVRCASFVPAESVEVQNTLEEDEPVREAVAS